MKQVYRADLDRARRLLERDPEAFEAFFDESFQRLYRFALVRVDRDAGLAREVVQATLCKAIDRLESYRGEAPMFSWLCSICRHEILDQRGRERRFAAVDLLEEEPAVRAALEAMARVATPEDEARGRELQRLVHAALDHLPFRYGEALEMRYVDGLPVPEIAARLELTYKATESVLSRARAAFRSTFAALAPRLSRLLPGGAADPAGGGGR